MVLFPDTMAQAPGPPVFDPPPLPWLLTMPLPGITEDPATGILARVLARRFDWAAVLPLVARAERETLGLSMELASLGKPLASIRVAGIDDPEGDESAVYLVLFSMALFGSSTLIGYVTCKHPAYSLCSDPLRVGGQPRLPAPLLPPYPARG